MGDARTIAGEWIWTVSDAKPCTSQSLEAVIALTGISCPSTTHRSRQRRGEFGEDHLRKEGTRLRKRFHMYPVFHDAPRRPAQADSGARCELFTCRNPFSDPPGPTSWPSGACVPVTSPFDSSVRLSMNAAAPLPSCNVGESEWSTTMDCSALRHWRAGQGCEKGR